MVVVLAFPVMPESLFVLSLLLLLVAFPFRPLLILFFCLLTSPTTVTEQRIDNCRVTHLLVRSISSPYYNPEWKPGHDDERMNVFT